MSVRDVIQAAAGASTTADKTYIEDVFSTYLYTGNGSTQTINNGIDLAGKGGMVWIKDRTNTNSHFLFDTIRGVNAWILSNSSTGQNTSSNTLTGFNDSGFSIGANTAINTSTANYASWTFRKAPKFFDVVTYTGNNAGDRNITHNLGSAPGMIIVKSLNSTNNWAVYHRSLSNSSNLKLNLASASAIEACFGVNSAQTATTFQLGTANLALTNALGSTYVAYLFAHDTTTDGLIQCGSYTGNGSATGPSVTLGWEPQYLMIKNASGTGNWQIIDSMRGMPVGSAEATLQANLPNAESSVEYVSPTATGFQVTSTSSEVNTSGSTYVYMAIRRGPMRAPTNGTKVFSITQAKFNGTVWMPSSTADFMDTVLWKGGQSTTTPWWLLDRIRGIDRMDAGTTTSKALVTSSTAAEANVADQQNANVTNPRSTYLDNNRIGVSGDNGGFGHLVYGLRRAPGFFDVVCYTGTGAARTVNHNLGVAPELIIIKPRNSASSWVIGSNNLGWGNALFMSTAASSVQAGAWNNTTPTSTLLTVGVNNSGSNVTFVAYLFASCPGVSKVGSYVGNGSSQTINCGFTAGARFVMIKRTNSTGDWYVWDTARGIVSANDPRLSLNSTAAEVTTDDTIDPDSTGFIVNQVTATNVNVSAATYIYLAIA